VEQLKGASFGHGLAFQTLDRGARYLTGEKLKDIWAEFLTFKFGRFA